MGSMNGPPAGAGAAAALRFSHWQPAEAAATVRGLLAISRLAVADEQPLATEMVIDSPDHVLLYFPREEPRQWIAIDGHLTAHSRAAQTIVAVPGGSYGWLLATGRLLHGMVQMRCSRAYFEQLTAQGTAFQLLRHQNVGRLALMFDMLGEAIAYPSQNGLLVDALSHTILRLHARGIDQATGGGLAGWQVRRSIDRIRSQLAEPPLLADLAEDVGLSAFHFARQFKQSIGLSPHEFLQAVRLDEAERLLVETHLPVARIARSLGLSKPGSFSRLFRARVGCTPVQFRQARGRPTPGGGRPAPASPQCPPSEAPNIDLA